MSAAKKPLSRPARRRRPADRRGATLVLIAVMSTALLSVGALVINWSYLELSNTQLRSATDAAVKAAVVTLSQTQDQDLARQAAKDIAANYSIGGNQLILADGDIVFGNSELQDSGGYLFTANQEPINSAQVISQVGGNSATAAVPVFFAHLISPSSVDLAKDAVAGRFDHDIVVVVDRSGSMAWDLSGVEFSYPGEYWDDSMLQNYFREPHPDESRWAKLIDALAVFKDVVDGRDLNAQIGLASYSSDYVFGLYQSYESTADQLMSFDTSAFLTAAEAIGEEPIIGDTNIHSGMTEGAGVLLGSERRGTAHRTMVLLSDGHVTAGGDPVAKAADLYANDRVTIHTISFGDGADQATMAAIAEASGGEYYHALTADELSAAFEEIAEQLPAVLTQ